MSLSLDEARAYLIGLMPPGSADLYDLEPGGDFYKIFDALGALMKTRGFDLIDDLRREIIPGQWVNKLPDWEKFLGIANTFAALFGSDAARQLGIKGKLRESGPFADAVVASVVSPLLGYFPATPVEILKCSRTGLDLYHTYTLGTTFSIPNGQTLTDLPLRIVADGGKISKGGARLLLEYVAAAGPFTATLVGPDGTTQTFSLNINGEALSFLFARNFIGKAITEDWTLTIANTSGGLIQLLWSVRADGIAPGQDTGGAIWWWGVYADPAHIGENGSPPDFPSVLRAIARIKHSHGVGRLIRSKGAYPGVLSGAHCAIPNQFIPSS